MAGHPFTAMALATAAALGTSALLASPALAEGPAALAALLAGLGEPDASTQMTAGYAACLLTPGDAEATANSFTANGWLRKDDAEQGLIALTPAEYERTSALLAADGSFCKLESITLTTAQAAQLLNMTVTLAGLPAAQMGTDAAGCMTFTLADGTLASLTSGGRDPVCSSTVDSAMRFTTAPH